MKKFLHNQLVIPTRRRRRKEQLELFITMALFFVLGMLLGAILWIK